MSDLTYGDAIEAVFRRLMPAVRDQAVQLAANYTANGESVELTGPQTGAVHVGSTLAIDQEVLFVTAWDSTTGVASVSGGYVGSEPADHTASTLVYVDPKFSRFEIGTALNDAINEMTSYGGLYQVPAAASFTFNPVYSGYDLGGLPENFIDIIEIRYKVAPPTHNFPLVKCWDIIRNVPDPIFPSGRGLVIHDGGWPGLPVYVSYMAPFTPLVNLTDGLNAVGGLPLTSFDIPIMGAEINLVVPREVKRNFIESQPDSRKAPEVPPGATANAGFAILKRWQQRIDDEASLLRRKYPSRHPGW